MAKIVDLEDRIWKKWVDSKPEVIQHICKQLPPDRLYLLKISGKRVTIHSYEEDGTVTVNVPVEYNDNPLTSGYQVFGILPEDLEECGLP